MFGKREWSIKKLYLRNEQSMPFSTKMSFHICSEPQLEDNASIYTTFNVDHLTWTGLWKLTSREPLQQRNHINAQDLETICTNCINRSMAELKYGGLVAVLATYTVSSLLHGLNYPLAAILMSLGVYTYVEYSVRYKLSVLLDACVTARPCPAHCMRHKHSSSLLPQSFIWPTSAVLLTPPAPLLLLSPRLSRNGVILTISAIGLHLLHIFCTFVSNKNSDLRLTVANVIRSTHY
ncbi:hypothetical protein J6590_082584 [Homalodisca vitripennis]|nr:hypothetical protein J6590_082584 [Homalodisca vitripennis]